MTNFDDDIRRISVLVNDLGDGRDGDAWDRCRVVLEAAGNNPLDVAELLKAVLNGRGEKIGPPKDCAYAALPEVTK